MIDLRSDTVTRPNKAMRQAMADAEVGDDVFGDDPSVNALQQKIATMAGKQAALLLPSGTQSNLVAMLTHCQRGDEYIVGQDYHTYLYEAGGAAVLGSIQPQPISVQADGSLDLNKVKQVIKPDDSHFARSKLLVLENTHNGKVLGLDYLASAQQFSRQHKLSLHLDGARVFNAVTKLNVELSEITQYVDSVSICFSKGLGAPVGSLLCGSEAFIQQAKRWRKMLGGGMRQAGVLAAAINYAVDNNIAGLQHDHLNAQLLAEGLTQALQSAPQFSVVAPQTNILYLHLSNEELGERLAQALLQDNILICGGSTIRLVTHRDINKNDVTRAVTLISQFLLNPDNRV